MKRDADLEKISSKLVGCSPFLPDPSLRNVVTGIVAQDGMNIHEYESVGRNTMHKLIGQPAFAFSFSWKDKARDLVKRQLSSLLLTKHWFRTSFSMFPGSLQHWRAIFGGRAASEKRTQYSSHCKLHCRNRVLSRKEEFLSSDINKHRGWSGW